MIETLQPGIGLILRALSHSVMLSIRKRSSELHAWTGGYLPLDSRGRVSAREHGERIGSWIEIMIIDRIARKFELRRSRVAAPDAMCGLSNGPRHRSSEDEFILLIPGNRHAGIGVELFSRMQGLHANKVSTADLFDCLEHGLINDIVHPWVYPADL